MALNVSISSYLYFIIGGSTPVPSFSGWELLLRDTYPSKLEFDTFSPETDPFLSSFLSHIFWNTQFVWGLPWWVGGKESTCQCRRREFDPWVRKIPWRRKWQPSPIFLPEKSCRQRSLAGYSPWGLRESDTTEQLNSKNGERKIRLLPYDGLIPN